MKSFITALQFLTRIRLVSQPDLTIEDFGRSVRCFTLVGLVLGSIQFLIGSVLISFLGISYVTAAIFVLLPILLTGGLHCDGFMDTVDGLFSGRSRERMLDIMKDSRTGSFGVVAFGCCLLLDFALVLDLGAAPTVLLVALFVLPVFGRMAMVLAVAAFPYARPEGMGKAFHELAGQGTVAFAGAVAIVCAAPWGPGTLLALAVAILFGLAFDRYAAGRLGGLTGDLYGATEKLTETATLFTYWILIHLPQAQMLLGGWHF